MLPSAQRNGQRSVSRSRDCIAFPSAAVSTLGKVMLVSATPPSTKVRAANSILDHTAKAIEIEEIEAI